MSYSGLGQQHSAIAEPPKDPISSTQVARPVQAGYTVVPVPMTPGLYTAPSVQTARPPSLQQMVPGSSTQAPVSNWRRQIERVLNAAGLMIMSLPEAIVTQLWGLLRGLAPDVQREFEVTSRGLSNPAVADVQIAEKLNATIDHYRSMRPSIPAPARVVIDPIVDSVWRIVPTEVRPAGSATVSVSVSASANPIISALNNAPWGWIAGSFVAGMAACSLFGSRKTTPNRAARRLTRRKAGVRRRTGRRADEAQAVKMLRDSLRHVPASEAIQSARNHAYTSGGHPEVADLLSYPSVARRLLAKAKRSR